MTHAYLQCLPAHPKPKDALAPVENRAFKTMPDGREICNNHPTTGTSEGRAEYKRRLKLMWERQNGICCLAVHLGCCAGPLKLTEATWEHELGRGMGGAKRNDATEINGKWINGAACWQGNQMKGSRRIRYNG